MPSVIFKAGSLLSMCSIPSDDSADPQISQFCCLHWSDLHLQSTSAVHTHATPNRPAPLSIFQTPLGSSLKGGFEKASFFLSAHTPPPLLLLSLLFSLLLLPVSCSHPFFCLCFRAVGWTWGQRRLVTPFSCVQLKNNQMVGVIVLCIPSHRVLW